MREEGGDDKGHLDCPGEGSREGLPAIRPFPPDSPTQLEQKSQLPIICSIIPLAQNIKMLLIFKTEMPSNISY